MNGQRPPLEPIRSAYRLQYLTDEQLDQLQDATLEILEKVGVKLRAMMPFLNPVVIAK